MRAEFQSVGVGVGKVKGGKGGTWNGGEGGEGDEMGEREREKESG